ncbi:elongator complex protein 4 [Panicum miliaceum]|uniref:Elongator complex protein 4 n=1 Tax=Panicum miliaceum TaxID=4540 RepID=A0A3L6S9N6_PANMI|nr:elongator complex protein 4 [Panicum miliaceum]
MAAARGQTLGRSSFSRTTSNPAASSSGAAGVKLGPNGAAFVSSGIPDLDRPLKEPRLFLGTLPAPVSSSKEDGRHRVMGAGVSSDGRGNDEGLRIAWQYKKYFGDEKASSAEHKDNKQKISNDFDLRKPLERHLLNGQNIECVSTQDADNLRDLQDHCSTFLSKLPGKDCGSLTAGRIAIQSLCAPQCGYFEKDWDMIQFIRLLKAKEMATSCRYTVVYQSNSRKAWPFKLCVLITISTLYILQPFNCPVLVTDEDKDLAKLLTGYQDMVGFLHVHKVAQTNSQVPVILEASTLSLKLHKRRSLMLERLNQAPVDGSSGPSSAASGSCSSLQGSQLDF